MKQREIESVQYIWRLVGTAVKNKKKLTVDEMFAIMAHCQSLLES